MIPPLQEAEMPEIILTEEQARILAMSNTTVFVRDPSGASVGALDPREAAIIAEAKRRLARPGPRYSAENVSAMMDALEAERKRIGRFGVEYMEEFVERTRAANPALYGPSVVK
jgi:hypothetical protein